MPLDRTRLCDPDELRELWARTGLVEIDAGELVVGADYADFDDFWWPFPRASAAPAPTAPRSTRRDGTRCGTRSAAPRLADRAVPPARARLVRARATGLALVQQRPGDRRRRHDHDVPGLDTRDLEGRVKRMYRDVAEDPGQEFHFETGGALAERLGYPPDDLDRIPAEAVASFAGVGYFLDLAAIGPGERVLDLREEVSRGRLDPGAVDAVLGAAGHRVARRRQGPAGLTQREVEVLVLLARGLSNKTIATAGRVAQDRAQPHRAHLPQDRLLDTRRGQPVRDAARAPSRAGAIAPEAKAP